MSADVATTVEVRLEYAPPFCAAPLRRFLVSHAVPGLDRVDPVAGEHSRLVAAPHGPAVVSLVWGPEPEPAADPGHLLVRLALADPDDLVPVVGLVRGWLDLDADPERTDRALARDPLLAPLVAARPGLRVPGSLDGAQTALLTVLGQQVSLAAARTFGGRLVAAYGQVRDDGFTTTPEPAVIAAAHTETLRATIGITGARARALQAVAAALADGLVLAPGQDPDAVRAALVALPGIGPWTADYLALRCLGDRDAFLPDDLVLRRALGVKTRGAALALAEPWRPWRGYALLHLWTSAVFV